MNELISVYITDKERSDFEIIEIITKIDRIANSYNYYYCVGNNYLSKIEEDRDERAFCFLRDVEEELKDDFAYSYCGALIRDFDSIIVTEDRKYYRYKFRKYEEYYLRTKKFAHEILVNNKNELVDGFFSYKIAKKYGTKVDVYQIDSSVRYEKVVICNHIKKNGSLNTKDYIFIYDIHEAVVPGDILYVDNKKKVVVREITYLAGQSFCESHKKILKHSGKMYDIKK